MGNEFSDPYSVEDKQFMLMGEHLDDGRVIIGEIDLSFVKAFVHNMASVADANGNFFVSGDNPEIDWKTTADLPEHTRAETVPELGWQIVVHSEEHKPEKDQRPYKENEAILKFKREELAQQWFAQHPELTVIEENRPFYVVHSQNETTEALLQSLRLIKVLPLQNLIIFTASRLNEF